MSAFLIALADDQQIFRREMISLLHSMQDVKVSIEATDGNDLLNQIRQAEQKPWLAIIDLNMPGKSGAAILPALKKEYPGIKVIVLSQNNNSHIVSYLTGLGADAYFFKDDEPFHMQDVIRSLMRNG
jgi:two-component system response regulator DegU